MGGKYNQYHLSRTVEKGKYLQHKQLSKGMIDMIDSERVTEIGEKRL